MQYWTMKVITGLPRTYKGKGNQRTAAQEAVLLAKEIEDETMQEMALAGILSFSDKIIDKKLANEIRRCLSMTKVGAIIAKEMEESEEKGRQEGRTEGQLASLRTVLLLKGKISEKLEAEIQKQTKTEILEQWLKIAVESPDVDAFEAKITEYAENF